MPKKWTFGLLMVIGLLAGCAPIRAPETPVPVTAIPAPGADAAPDELETRATSVSPDGKWRAESVVAFPADHDEYYQRLTVTRSGGQAAWTPVETWSHMGLGYTIAVPFAWSAQDEALYFTNLPVPDGCALFVNSFGLLRLDLATGEIDEILPGRGLALALSPQEDRVAEIVDGPPTLLLHSLDTGELHTLALPQIDATTQAGSLVWSPDGAQIALALAHDPCMGGWARATSVMVVDVATLETTALISEDTRLLKPVAWTEVDGITLEGEGATRFRLDPQTGEITPQQ